MWYPFLFLGRNLVRDDRQASVQLHRVAIDDLAIVAFGELYR
jgi:hypothetical protein